MTDMRLGIFIYLAMALLSSCSFLRTGDGMDDDWTQYADSIERCRASKSDFFERKKLEMMAMPDDEYEFWWTDDPELESNDPHAYWLMNRMMLMAQMVKTADDGWAWMLAMNECVERYNGRLGRQIGSPQQAMMAVDELMGIYCCGNQPEMNAASYVDMISAHYLTLCEYGDLMDFVELHNGPDGEEEAHFKALYYQEYSKWFDMNNAANGLMTFYTYGAARYSAWPMDVNFTFGYWSKTRLEELEVEWEAFGFSDDGEAYRSKARSVSPARFAELLDYFRTRTQQTVIEEYLEPHEEKDYAFAEERLDGFYDFEKIAEMVRYYETALDEWRDVRRRIGLQLSEPQRTSYREITKQVHARLYEDLEDLKGIMY